MSICFYFGGDHSFLSTYFRIFFFLSSFSPFLFFFYILRCITSMLFQWYTLRYFYIIFIFSFVLWRAIQIPSLPYLCKWKFLACVSKFFVLFSLFFLLNNLEHVLWLFTFYYIFLDWVLFFLDCLFEWGLTRRNREAFSSHRKYSREAF